MKNITDKSTITQVISFVCRLAHKRGYSLGDLTIRLHNAWVDMFGEESVG